MAECLPMRMLRMFGDFRAKIWGALNDGPLGEANGQMLLGVNAPSYRFWSQFRNSYVDSLGGFQRKGLPGVAELRDRISARRDRAMGGKINYVTEGVTNTPAPKRR